MACPNKNTPEWRVLEDALGVFGAYKVFIANSYEIPNMNQITEFLDAINPIYDLEYNQLSPSDVQIYQDQLINYKDNYGVEPSKEFKKTIENLLLQQTKITKENKVYYLNENGTKIELQSTTDYIESSKDGYYKFEGQEELYENNREWGNQIDTILSSVLKNKSINDAKNDLLEYTRSTNTNILITESVFEDLYKEFTNFKEKFKGSVILTQITFYNKNKGIAGTADIVVVNPNGNLQIFDLKSSVNPTNYDPVSKRFLSYNKSGFNNQYDRQFIKKDGTKKSSKKERHAAQLSIYKAMAINQNYTFEIDKELGIVPIHISETFEDVVVKAKQEEIFYLDSSKELIEEFSEKEDTSEDLELYKYTSYQKLLNKVKEVLETRILYLERKGPNRAEKYIISQLKEKINTTEETKAIVNFITDIHTIFIGNSRFPGAVKQIENFIQDVNSKKITDPSEIITKLMTNKETIEMFKPLIEEIQGFIAGEVGIIDSKPGSPLNMCEKIITAFNRIDLLYKSNINKIVASELTKSISPTANKKHIEEIKSQEEILSRLDPESTAYKARKKRLDKLKDDIGEDGVTFNTLLGALENGSNKDIPFVDYLLTPIISSSNPILALFGKTLKKNYENARQVSIKKAHEASKAFSNYVKNSKVTKDNVYSFNKSFFNRIKQYDFSTKSMRETLSFVQEIDISSYNVALNNMLTQAEKMEDIQEKRKFIENWYLENTEALPFKDVVIENPLNRSEKVVIQKGRETIIKEKLQLVERKIISQREFDNWLENNQIEINGIMYFSRDFSTPSKSKYPSQEYKNIQKNPELKNYYDYLIFTYFSSQLRIPESTRKGYILPSVSKSDIDRLVENGAINYMRNSWRNLVEFTEKDAYIYGEKVEGLKVIPVLYTNNMPVDDISVDLISSVLLFDQATLKFEAANNTVSLGEAALQSVKENPPLKTDTLGNKIISEAAKKAGITNWDKYLKKNDGNNIAALLSVFIDMQIYNISMVESKVAVAGRVIDFNKIVNNLMAVGSFIQIGGNPIGSAANSLQANAQLLIESATSEYFNEKELIWAKYTYYKNLNNYAKDFGEPVNKSFIGQIIDLYDPMQGVYTDRYGRKISQSQFKKAWSTDVWFFLQNAGEHAAQVQTLLAMLKRNKVKRTINNKTEEISLIDAYELGKDGIIKLKEGVVLEGNISDNNLVDIDLQNSLHALNKRINGIYNGFDKLTAERHALSRLLLMYRKFFVPGLKRRWKTYGIDQELGSPTEGYYNTFFRLMRTQLSDMSKQLSPFHTTENLTPLEKKNLLKATRDLGLYFSTLLVVMILRSMYEGADDDKKVLAYSLVLTMRLNQEISSLIIFTNPLSLWKITKSPMATQSLIEKLIKLSMQIVTDPFEKYDKNTGKNKKGDLKVVAQLLKALGLDKNVTTPEELIKILEKASL
jgi:hypothetical protein